MIESAVLFKTRQYNTTFWTDGYLKNSNHHHHQQNYPRPGSAGRRVAAGSEINVGPASAGYYKKHESSRKQVRLLQYFIFLVNFFPSPFVRLFKTHLFSCLWKLRGRLPPLYNPWKEGCCCPASLCYWNWIFSAEKKCKSHLVTYHTRCGDARPGMQIVLWMPKLNYLVPWKQGLSMKLCNANTFLAICSSHPDQKRI